MDEVIEVLIKNQFTQTLCKLNANKSWKIDNLENYINTYQNNNKDDKTHYTNEVINPIQEVLDQGNKDTTPSLNEVDQQVGNK